MLEMNLRQRGLKDSTCEPFTKIKREYQNSKKLEIHNVFIKTN